MQPSYDSGTERTGDGCASAGYQNPRRSEPSETVRRLRAKVRAAKEVFLNTLLRKFYIKPNHTEFSTNTRSPL